MPDQLRYKLSNSTRYLTSRNNHQFQLKIWNWYRDPFLACSTCSFLISLAVYEYWVFGLFFTCSTKFWLFIVWIEWIEGLENCLIIKYDSSFRIILAWNLVLLKHRQMHSVTFFTSFSRPLTGQKNICQLITVPSLRLAVEVTFYMEASKLSMISMNCHYVHNDFCRHLCQHGNYLVFNIEIEKIITITSVALVKIASFGGRFSLIGW